jgi:hypothetical protein
LGSDLGVRQLTVEGEGDHFLLEVGKPRQCGGGSIGGVTTDRPFGEVTGPGVMLEPSVAGAVSDVLFVSAGEVDRALHTIVSSHAATVPS